MGVGWSLGVGGGQEEGMGVGGGQEGGMGGEEKGNGEERCRIHSHSLKSTLAPASLSS